MCNGVCCSALINVNAFDDAKDLVVLIDCVLKLLKYERCTTFGSTVAVSTLVKCLTLACRAKEVSTVQPKVHLALTLMSNEEGQFSTRLTSGLVIMFTPPATAALQSPARSALEA